MQYDNAYQTANGRIDGSPQGQEECHGAKRLFTPAQRLCILALISLFSHLLVTCSHSKNQLALFMQEAQTTLVLALRQVHVKGQFCSNGNIFSKLFNLQSHMLQTIYMAHNVRIYLFHSRVGSILHSLFKF